jgi:hypothetical protein
MYKKERGELPELGAAPSSYPPYTTQEESH